jgi:chaperone BCS1
MSTSQDLIVPPTPTSDLTPSSFTTPPTTTTLWPEPLDTPGIIPQHLVRSASSSLPIFEVLQRILHRLRLHGTMSDVEKVLALIGLYKAVQPAYRVLKDLFFWACTVQISISENDPVAKEVLAWMGSNVMSNDSGRARSAMLVTGGLDSPMGNFTMPMQYPGYRPAQAQVEEKVACVPSVGTRLFW